MLTKHEIAAKCVTRGTYYLTYYNRIRIYEKYVEAIEIQWNRLMFV